MINRTILFLLPVVFWVGFSAAAAGESGGETETASIIQQADDLTAQGIRSQERGDFAGAVSAFGAAADLYGNAGEQGKKTDAVFSQAHAYLSIGQYPKAIESLHPLLDQEKNGGKNTTRLMGTLGLLYHLTGEPKIARDYLKSSLARAREADNKRAQAAILNTLGMAHASEKNDDKALAAYEASERLAAETGLTGIAVKANVNAARVCCDIREPLRADSFLASALAEMGGLKDTHEKANALVAIGRLYRRISRFQQTPDPVKPKALGSALAAYASALKIADSLDDPVVKSYALGYKGQLYEDTGRYDESLHLTRQAAFWAQKARSNESLYLWQWQTGRLLIAQGSLDESIAAYHRAVYSLESIREDVSVVCNRGNRLSFRDTVGPVYFELADLLLQRSAVQSAPEKRRSDLLEARETVEKLKAVEMQDYFRDECVTALQSKVTGLEQIAGNTAAIYPILLPDRTELLVTIAGDVKQFTVETGSEAITAEVRRFRAKLQQPTRRPLIHAKRLYNWLITPMEKDLVSNGIETLIFIPDGPLRTIPLAALHDGKEYLINRFAIVTTPGLTLTDPHPIHRENVYSLVSGLTEAVQGFSPLPKVSQELEQIQNLYSSVLLKNQDFNTVNMKKALTNRPFSIIHIASHGQFDRDPKKTFLLTYDGKLTMDDLDSLMGLGRFRKKPVELLTLSACQTAAGDDRAALGLAGVALRAGARSAIATLWFIDDDATSRLIPEFYRQLQDPSATKAHALQQAQLTLMAQEEFKHPAYWGPFLLIGNWL